MNFHSYYRYPISPEPVTTNLDQIHDIFTAEAMPWDDKEVLDELFEHRGRLEHPPLPRGILIDITGEWPNRKGFDYTYRTAQNEEEAEIALKYYESLLTDKIMSIAVDRFDPTYLSRSDNNYNIYKMLFNLQRQ